MLNIFVVYKNILKLSSYYFISMYLCKNKQKSTLINIKKLKQTNWIHCKRDGWVRFQKAESGDDFPIPIDQHGLSRIPTEQCFYIF